MCLASCIWGEHWPQKQTWKTVGLYHRCEHGKQLWVHENKTMNNGKANRDHLENALGCDHCLLCYPLFFEVVYFSIAMQNNIFWCGASAMWILINQTAFSFLKVPLCVSYRRARLSQRMNFRFLTLAPGSERDVVEHRILLNGFTLMNGLSSALHLQTRLPTRYTMSYTAGRPALYSALLLIESCLAFPAGLV